MSIEYTPVMVVTKVIAKGPEMPVEEGRIQVESFDEIYEEFTEKKVSAICEEFGCYLEPGPVTVTHLINYKVTVHEAHSQRFNSLSDMTTFLEQHRGYCVHSITRRKDTQAYLLRYFDDIKFTSMTHHDLEKALGKIISSVRTILFPIMRSEAATQNIIEAVKLSLIAKFKEILENESFSEDCFTDEMKRNALSTIEFAEALMNIPPDQQTKI